MRYILPTGALIELKTLREKYQEARNVDLSKKPSRIGLPLALGGTDVVSRNKQINFILKIIESLDANLLEAKDITSLEQQYVTAESFRTLLTACWYVDSQIKGTKSHSQLYMLIKKALGVSPQNFFDEQDKEACYFSAQRLLVENSQAFSKANAAIERAELQPFSEKEWSDFMIYLKKSTIKPAPPSDYQMTIICQRLFGTVFTYAGATSGFLVGEVMSNSTKVMSSKLQLTAMVGSSMIFLGSASPAGVAFIAPAIAARLIDTFFKISLADILGFLMGVLGQSVGISVGLTLDLSYHLLRNICVLIGRRLYSEPKAPQIDGMRIADGKFMCSGIVIELIPVEKLPKDYDKTGIKIHEDGTLSVGGKVVDKKTALKINNKDGLVSSDEKTRVEINEDGTVSIDGSVVDVEESVKKLPLEVLEELQAQIKNRFQSSEEVHEDDEEAQDEEAKHEAQPEEEEEHAGSEEHSAADPEEEPEEDLEEEERSSVSP